MRAGETPLRSRSEGQPEEAEGADRSRGDGGGEFSGDGTGDLERGESERKKREVWARFRVAGWDDVVLLAELVAAVESVELLVDDDGGVQLAEEDESESDT